MIKNVNVIDWPLNDNIFPLSFFKLKLKLEMKSLDSKVYHCKPPLNFSIYFYPGSTSIVKLWIIRDLSPLKNIPWAILRSKKFLSNEVILCIFGIIPVYPKRSLKLSSWTKLICLPFPVSIFIIKLSFETMGLFSSG